MPCYLLTALWGLLVSQGTISDYSRKSAKKLHPSLQAKEDIQLQLTTPKMAAMPNVNIDVVHHCASSEFLSIRISLSVLNFLITISCIVMIMIIIIQILILLNNHIDNIDTIVLSYHKINGFLS